MNKEQAFSHYSDSHSLHAKPWSLDKRKDGTQQHGHFYYQPTPPPETVIVHSVPKKSKDACCWGCAAALCLCFGLKECCT
ncbi:uncharacterized protein BX663DRAFT_527704 [Cokeromyces recurvatus]|uniref:uncharacterized protein n=1 Tax=Cokeromyces recurvatus TaxID=90255 RepID=UPI002220984E|nr:uncharacterized protein BX663DRAFT_527704 [Cokeromyces recurvatus]KAI7897619.1 hypothetical protein BX663DRAFT_527704 [Cokeromyces recurvatus]